MKEVLITSGTSFEGYDIVGYGTYKFTQTILNSNFLKDFGTSIADIATDRRDIYQEKIDEILNETINNFTDMVRETKYNAVVGFRTGVEEYTNNVTAVVASGTLVNIKEQYKSEFDKSSFIRNEIYVRNYYDLLVPRASKVVLASEGKGTKISVWFNNYNNDDIKALKAELQFTNIYGDNITLPDVDFTFDKTNLKLLKSDYVECKLPDKYIKMISSVKVYIKKYVKASGVYEIDADSIGIEMSDVKFKALKLKKGIDAVPDNFLFVEKEGREEIRLIDWEYAGMQDPHVDVAMFCIYSLYNKRQVDRLIAAYFKEGCDDATRIKIYCYIAACGLLWSNWCEYKRNLGVEFGEYSLRQYRYAKDYYRIVQEELKKQGEKK